jgi:hypothetical protein
MIVQYKVFRDKGLHRALELSSHPLALPFSSQMDPHTAGAVSSFS